MALGAVKKLMIDKHCGFIAPSTGGPDVFFHGSTVADSQFASLWQGQRVEFDLDADVGPADRGPRASRVRAILTEQPAASPQQAEFRQLRRHHASRAKKPTWRDKGG